MTLFRNELRASAGRTGIAGAALLALVSVAGCSESSSSQGAGPVMSTTPSASTQIQQESEPTTAPASTTAVTTVLPPTPPETTTSATAAERPPDCGPVVEVPELSGDSTDVVEVGTVDGVTVSAGMYPLPHDRGDPWSQWGQGIVLPSGRYVSAVGDHLGVDGNSWFYEYDPASGRLARTADVAEALGHVSGDWGYGKIHAQMGLGPCGEVVAATYWGTRNDLVVGGSYQGNHLLRYDPGTAELTSLGVPVPGYGIPSMAISPDGRHVFGEAVDPRSRPDAGPFFVADATTGEVLLRSDDAGHVGFRSILVDADGAAYFSAGEGRLVRYDPDAGDLAVAPGELPGDWLRAASGVAPDGSVFGVTRNPDRLFEMTADGQIVDMGPTEGYVTSIALSPDGSTLYYVPDAHGESWMNGTPLIAVDTASGDHEVLVELNPLIEPALGVRVGGTYNVAVDPRTGHIYVGLNASAVGSSDLEATFGSVVLAVVDPG
jgi:sugar lactone lactonase YvrE